MSQIDRLCDQLGIRIVPYRRRRRPRQTHARKVLRKMHQRHGEGHVVFVLRTIIDGPLNRAELWSETILAISDIVRMRPDLADKGGAFMEAFDALHLEEVREKARRLGVGPKRQVMRVLITEYLEQALAAPEEQGRLL